MRKVLSFLLVTALLILCLYAYATAEAEETYNVVYTVDTLSFDGSAPIPAGSTFDVHVSVNAIPSISMVELHLRYNKQIMLPVSSSTGGFLSLMPFNDCNIAPFVNTDNTTVYGEVWITGMDSNQYASTQGEIIATITFQAQQDIVNSSPVFCAQTPLAAMEGGGVHKLSAACVDGGIWFETAVTSVSSTSMTTATSSVVPPTVSRADTQTSSTIPLVEGGTTGSMPLVYGPGGAVVTLVPDTTHATMVTTRTPVTVGTAANAYRTAVHYGWIIVVAVLAGLSVAGAILVPRHKQEVKALYVKARDVLYKGWTVVRDGITRVMARLPFSKTDPTPSSESETLLPDEDTVKETAVNDDVADVESSTQDEETLVCEESTVQEDLAGDIASEGAVVKEESLEESADETISEGEAVSEETSEDPS